MFIRKRRVAKKRMPIRRKRVVKKHPVGVSSSVAKYVKKVVSRNIENKTVSEKNEINFAAYFVNADLKVQTISPAPGSLVINQGVGQGERIGNTIKTRKLLLKYVLFPNKYEATINDQPLPQEVIIWIGYLKNNRMKVPDVTDFANFFQNGSGTSAPYSNLWDVTLPVNQDLFHICKTIRHKIGNAIYTDYQGIKPNNYYTNNDFKLNSSRTVDCTAYINKTLKFNDTSTTPDTGLYMWMTAVNADGSIAVYNISTVGMFYTLRYDYEDA